MSRPKGGKERPTTCNAFDNEWFGHLPYMDISSSGESPFVVAAHTCETSATYCVWTRTRARPAFPRARCEFAHYTSDSEIPRSS